MARMNSPGLHVGGVPGKTDLVLPGLGAGAPNGLWTENRGNLKQGLRTSAAVEGATQ